MPTVTATWNTSGGDWFIASNWDEPNQAPPPPTVHFVPGADNDVTFGNTGPYTVTYNGTDTVNSLSGAQMVTLAIGGGSLTVGVGGGNLGSLGTVAQSSFTLADGAHFNIVGATANAGTIALDAGIDATQLTFGLAGTPSPVSLTGGGKITLSDSANNDIFIDNSASLDNVDNTISGAGSITSNFQSLTNEAKGIIDATGTNGLTVDLPTFTNAGLLEATGTGGLQLEGDTHAASMTIENAGGTIAAIGAGTHVDLSNGTTIAGGTLTTSGGGVVQVTLGTCTLDGSGANSPVTITAGSAIRLADGTGLILTGAAPNGGVYVNHGTIALNSTGDATKLTVGTVSLQGGGAVTLSDSASNSISIENDGSLDNVDNTISGAGSISANFTSLTNEAEGVIDATGTNGLLLSLPTVTNKGLLEATGPGGLQISDPNGTIVANVGGTISATASGSHVDLDGVTIQGGSLGGMFRLTGANALDGTGANAPLTIVAGSTLQLADGSGLTLTGGTAMTPGVIVNHGTITLNSTVDQTRLGVTAGLTVSLQGGGEVTLSDNANNNIFDVQGAILDNVDNTISGAGSFGGLTNEASGIVDATGTANGLSASFTTITNRGLLEDTGTAGLQLSDDTVVDAGGTISASGAGTHVDLDGTTIEGGTLTTAAGGMLEVTGTVDLDGSTAGAATVSGAVTGTGTLALTAGTTTFASGATLATSNLSVAGSTTAVVAESLAYAGALGNNGTVELDGAHTLELAGTDSGSGKVSFAPTAAATLQLDETALPDGQTFANTVAGFSAGDVIDLRGLTFADNMTPTYDSTSGTLTVTEGATTDTLILTTPGATDFTLASDGQGGTDIFLCFAAGTRIRVVRGDVAVEELRVGDRAVTASGASRPIRWIGSRTVDCGALRVPSEAWPVRVRAGAFGGGLPERDLHLSPGHPVLVGQREDEALVPIMCLINGTSVARAPVDSIGYWHVELDAHDILLAEGLPAESFLDWGNRPWFENGADHALTNPDFIVPGLDGRCRPVAIEGPLVEAERRRLDALFVTSLVAPCAWPTGEVTGWDCPSDVARNAPRYFALKYAVSREEGRPERILKSVAKLQNRERLPLITGAVRCC